MFEFREQGYLGAAYDTQGRLTSLTNAMNQTVTLGYQAGFLSFITSPSGRTTHFTYDARGNRTSYTDKLGHTTTYVYDASNHIISTTDRAGQVITNTYDAAGRLIDVTAPNLARHFTYDALGRQTSASTENHLITMTYDESGMTSQTQAATGSSAHPYVTASWSLTHNQAGQLTHSVGPAFDVVYTYDDRGRLEQLTDSVLGEFGMNYDTFDRMQALERPNGASTAYGYDAADRLTQLSTTASSSLVYSLAYTYDATSGFPATFSDGDGTTSYTHDLLGRLLSVDHPAASGIPDESYTYDGAYRRTSSSGQPADYNAGDAIVGDATYTYAYDAEGRRTLRMNRATAEIVSYSWDGVGQLIGVETAQGSWTFDYDALGRRVRVAGPQNFVRTFAYDDNDLVRVVYDADGSVLSRYLTGFAFGSVLARVEAGVTTYPLRDKAGFLFRSSTRPAASRHRSRSMREPDTLTGGRQHTSAMAIREPLVEIKRYFTDVVREPVRPCQVGHALLVYSFA